MRFSKYFITKTQIEKLVDIPFSEFGELLRPYIKFKGVVFNQSEPIYAEGYFIIVNSEDIKGEFYSENKGERFPLCEPVTPFAIVKVIKGTNASNAKHLFGKTLVLKNTVEVSELLFSFPELQSLMNKLGAPKARSLEELTKKEYSYDVNLLNQRSNFTLDDTAKIAANINLNGFLPPNSLKNHYLELLSDCIKGSNQDDFKLHTVELWCSYHDEFGERYSKSYDNGTYLKQKVVLDYQLTIISKQEFVRWCEYESVDTGLTFEPKGFDESIEALKAENEKLKSQIRPQGFQQAPPSMPNNNSEKIKELNIKTDQLTEELDLLKNNSFPIMTSKLKAALRAQNKFWLSYDENNPPLQKTVRHFIEKELGLNSLKDNRDAAELTRAIQPEKIKRK
jgi:hypothetical protein